MTDTSVIAPPVKFVIWDLDGTILETETVLLEVQSQVLSENGKSVSPEIEKIAAGVRPLDAWKTIAQMLELDKSAEALYERAEELLNPRWSEVNFMPGALRALEHLKSNGIRMALATSTYQRNLVKKMAGREHLKDFFDAIVCGDELENGKPSPDIFLKAASLLGGKPEECLVVEDAPAGAQAGVSAGMRVLVVPSLTDINSYPPLSSSKLHGVMEVLPSLLNFNPAQYGHPPFNDFVCGAIPVSPSLFLKGTVVKGFGRGSKELGIPTANLDSESIKSTVAKALTGIYLGWASISSSPTVYKMVMSIGWNPFYNNKEKTAEPWLLHTFEEDFYNEEIRVVACGYIRPEANFNSLEELITRIHKDAEISREALEHESMRKYKDSSFLKPE